MSAPATNPLEDLLSEALHARADLLQAHDLAPASPPAVVVPLHRRGPAVAGIVATALVAAAAVVAVAVGGDPAPVREDTPPATQSASPSATAGAEPTPGPLRTDDRFTEDDEEYVDPGSEVSYDDGSTAVVSADSTTLTVTDPRGQARTARLPLAQDDAPNRLSGVQLDLGEAGVGYLVRYGEEYAKLTVLVPRGDDLLPAVVPDAVPFGDGFVELDKRLAYEGAGYRTWVKDRRLFTQVMVGEAPDGRYDVFVWEVAGDAPTLVATEIGTFCFDYVATPSTYQTC